MPVNGRTEQLGSFSTAIEAAKEYNRRAIEVCGDEAILNIISAQ
jgi:hypothetical protein